MGLKPENISARVKLGAETRKYFSKNETDMNNGNLNLKFDLKTFIPCVGENDSLKGQMSV